jgi:dihydroorotate dehydrogenase
MYKRFIRPILFLLTPEAVHHLVVFIVRRLSLIPGYNYLVKRLYSYHRTSLEKEVFGIKFPNPIGLAAGFDKNASLFNQFFAFGFGFIEIGTVTPMGQMGNPKPRSFRLRTDNALINRMGFNNDGIVEAVNKLKNRNPKLIIGGNIGKNTTTPNHKAVHDYEYCFEALYDYVDYFVVNVSCPNISDLKELQDQQMLNHILRQLMSNRESKPIKKPVLLKISPDLNQTQVDETIKIVELNKLDGIVATNTTVSREGLKTSKAKVEEIGKGGLSGAPITQRSTDMIRYIKKKSEGRIPIIGVGGIMSEQDALDKLEAGADLIQIYTGFIYEGPGFIKRILKSIEKLSH